MSSTCCQSLPEIFKWTDVVKSGVIVAAANILLLTILFADMGLIYVFSNFALVSAVVTIVYLGVMRFIQPSMEQEKEDVQYVYVSAETVQSILIKIINTKNYLSAYFKQLHQSPLQQIKAIVCLYVAAKVLSCFSVISFTWIVLNVLFAYGFVTFKLNLNLCELCKQQQEKVMGLVNLGLSFIPKYTPSK